MTKREILVDMILQCDKKNEVLDCYEGRPRKSQVAEIIADYLISDGVTVPTATATPYTMRDRLNRLSNEEFVEFLLSQQFDNLKRSFTQTSTGLVEWLEKPAEVASASLLVYDIDYNNIIIEPSCNMVPDACKACSNHPSNGGSGFCNCILGQPKVT